MDWHLTFNLGFGTNSVNLSNAQLTLIEYNISGTVLGVRVTMLNVTGCVSNNTLVEGHGKKKTQKWINKENSR